MPEIKLSAAAIALLSLAAIELHPRAQAEQVTWFGSRNEDGASLAYGTPSSGYGKIVFSCQAGQDELMFTYEHEPINAVDGAEVDAVLAAGDVEIAIPTTGTRLEIDDVYLLEGQAKLDDALRKLLTAGGNLTITVEDGAAEYPLEGAAEAAKHLLQVCSPDA